MYDKILHIVSFDNVFPPNYGGVIDVYYKCKALQRLGIQVYLHCFVKQAVVDKSFDTSVCTRIYFYPLKQKLLHPLRSKPLSVLSRTDEELLKNILEHPAPVLFESSKTTAIATVLRSKNYKVYLRLHNLEADYFKGLAQSETRPLMRWMYRRESDKLFAYEQNMWSGFERVFTLSHHEQTVVLHRGGNAVFVPIFHGNETLTATPGKGDFVLYHGDLKTADNRKVVWFLLDVFKKLPHVSLVIAAGQGLDMYQKAVSDMPNVRLQSFQSQAELIQLMNAAHISLSWSFQQSGTKVKLLNSLFHARFLIVNPMVVDDAQLVQECDVCQTAAELIQMIHRLMSHEWHPSKHRLFLCAEYLNDRKQAQLIAQEIFPNHSFSHEVQPTTVSAVHS